MPGDDDNTMISYYWRGRTYVAAHRLVPSPTLLTDVCQPHFILIIIIIMDLVAGVRKEGSR